MSKRLLAKVWSFMQHGGTKPKAVEVVTAMPSLCNQSCREIHLSTRLLDNDEISKGNINGTIQEKQYKEQKMRNEDAGELTELVRDFLEPASFYQACLDIGVDYFCGVPDSLLKDFCAYVTKNAPADRHVITANEGNAVALAAGYYLATEKHPLVYLQNSGLGNIVNPIMSLAVPSVYSIPMLLLIGWRGEPGKRDEPQHRTQGQTTPGLLAALGIPFQPLPDYQEGAEQALLHAKHYMEKSNGPYALLVKRQTFAPYKFKREPEIEFPLSREDALKIIVDNLSLRDIVVGSTGMLSRELFEYRVEKEMGHERDFLTVGSMGHCSSIALGIAKQKPKRQVFCLDGDGSVIMHMGAMATVASTSPSNYKHIIINNGAHDSVGGQPTDADNHEKFSFSAVALGCGYKKAMVAVNASQLAEGILEMRGMNGPVLLEVKVKTGSRKNLGRPTRSPQENKEDFMHFLAIN